LYFLAKTLSQFGIVKDAPSLRGLGLRYFQLGKKADFFGEMTFAVEDASSFQDPCPLG